MTSGSSNHNIIYIRTPLVVLFYTDFVNTASMRTALLSVAACIYCSIVIGAPLIYQKEDPLASEDHSLAGLQGGPPIAIWRTVRSGTRGEGFRRVYEIEATTKSSLKRLLPTMDEFLRLRDAITSGHDVSPEELPDKPIPTTYLMALGHSNGQSEPSESPDVGSSSKTQQAGANSDPEETHGGHIVPHEPNLDDRIAVNQQLLEQAKKKSPQRFPDHFQPTPGIQNHTCGIDTLLIYASGRPAWITVLIICFLTFLFLLSIIIVEMIDSVWRIARYAALSTLGKGSIRLNGPERTLVSTKEDFCEKEH